MDLQTYSLQNPYHLNNLRTRLSISLDQDKLFRAIDSDPDLAGAKVIFIDSRGTTLVLREEQGICRFEPVKVVLREPPTHFTSLDYVASIKVDQRESRLVIESAGAVLACGAMVLSWAVLITSGATIPITGGASAGFSVLAYGALAASAAQCMNSGYRVYNEVTEPAQNDYLDSQEWYRHATLAVDAISLGGATAAGMMTVRGIRLLKARDVQITTREALEGLNRQQRVRLSREIARARYPGISGQTLKALERAGAVERRYSNAAIRATTVRQIKDSIAAGMTYTGSALGGGINKIAVAIVSEQ